MAILVAATTHTKLTLTSSRELLSTTEDQADRVLDMEAKATELRQMLAETDAFTDRYDRIAYPLHMGQVISTVVRELPDSVTLDRIEIDSTHKSARSARSRGYDPFVGPPPRVLSGEVSGFAASDQQVAELVARLAATPPFADVSLDFSRTRAVRGHSARDFRLSFRIDLDATYVLADAPDGKELADVE